MMAPSADALVRSFSVPAACYGRPLIQIQESIINKKGHVRRHIQRLGEQSRHYNQFNENARGRVTSWMMSTGQPSPTLNSKWKQKYMATRFDNSLDVIDGTDTWIHSASVPHFFFGHVWLNCNHSNSDTELPLELSWWAHSTRQQHDYLMHKHGRLFVMEIWQQKRLNLTNFLSNIARRCSHQSEQRLFSDTSLPMRQVEQNQTISRINWKRRRKISVVKHFIPFFVIFVCLFVSLVTRLLTFSDSAPIPSSILSFVPPFSFLHFPQPLALDPKKDSDTTYRWQYEEMRARTITQQMQGRKKNEQKWRAFVSLTCMVIRGGKRTKGPRKFSNRNRQNEIGKHWSAVFRRKWAGNTDNRHKKPTKAIGTKNEQRHIHHQHLPTDKRWWCDSPE